MADSFWTAWAWVLVIEGLLPFLSPGNWRRTFVTLLALTDGQVRFFGLLCLMLGAIALVLLA